MAPSFLKDFRRKSKSSSGTDRSEDTSSNGSNGSNGITATKSTSTLNSAIDSTTPPFVQKSSSFANLQQQISAPLPAPPRPPYTSGSTRNSVSGMTGLGSPSPSLKNSLPTSQYAPRIVSISDGSWVSEILLISEAYSHRGCRFIRRYYRYTVPSVIQHKIVWKEL